MARPKQFYMDRKPRQIPARKKEAEATLVPLTAEGIKRLGGIDWATRKVSRLLGYPVKIYETSQGVDADTAIPPFIAEALTTLQMRELTRRLQ